MDDFIGLFLVMWIAFTTIVTGITLGSSNVTSHSHIIELCKDVGQFQYDKTVVLCEVKKEKTKE